MNSARRAFASGVIALIFLGLSFTTNASLLVYEGFNYPAGDSLTNSSALGSGGSFGWGGRWSGANNSFATNVDASLTFTDVVGNTLVTNGGSVLIGSTNGMAANAQPSRSFNFGTLTGSTYSGLTGPGTYWVSFIMQWVGPVTAGSATNQYPRKGDLAFRSGALTNANSTGNQLFAVGSPNGGNRIGTPIDTWTTWYGGDASGGVQNAGLAATAAPLNVPTFVLIRIDMDGTNTADTVYTWFNWTNLNEEPLISTANTTNNTANEDGWNNIRLDANGGNGTGTNTVLAVDEIRVGNTFSDVTPHSTGGSVQPPTITVPPTNTTVTATDPAVFSLQAFGLDLHYQWYFNTNTPVGTDTNLLTIASASTNDAGLYWCIVSNVGGSATSAPVTLTVLAPVKPNITTQPQSTSNAIGFTATFTVGAVGSSPLTYQWYFNGTTLLSGQTNPVLSFVIGSSNDVGGYSVLVTNKFGSVVSDSASLTIIQYGPDQLPGFPGADGAGKLASGGRRGIVYHVTKLNSELDDPGRASPGTLLYGLNSGNFPGGAPRTIVFDVAGVFHLGRMDTDTWTSGGNAWDATSRQGVSANNITIAGQTAPGPVIIMGGTLKMSGSNQVVRNITVAAGYGMKDFWETGTNPPPVGTLPLSYTMDAIEVDAQSVMIDHVTALFGSDETISCNELADKFTVQYCTTALAQNYNEHAYGHLLQPDTDHTLSYIHNLDAHIRARLPRVGSEVGTGALNDFRNNVQYNWLGDSPGYSGAQQYSKNNFINNFYLAGNGGDIDTSNTEAGGTGIFAGSSGYTTVYPAGNLKDTNKDGDPNDAVSADTSYTSSILQSSAYDISIGVTLNARDSFTNVLRYVGSRWWERDYDITLNNTGAINTIDERILHDVIAGTGRIQSWADDPFNISGTYVLDPVNEGAEWRSLWALRADTNGVAPYNRPAGWDTDGDGMPDYWEIAHGLNPNVPNNNGDFDNDGYTDLEEYLNDIAAWPAPGPILFTGDSNNRYALIFNWRVFGTQVNITNLGNTTTFSFWQPSRYDTAIISNRTVVVDAVGQDAGTLLITNNAALNITNGWLSVANRLQNSADSTLCVLSSGGLRVTNSLVNAGTMVLAGDASLLLGGTFTNTGTLDIMTWSGVLPQNFMNLGTVLDHSLVVFTAFRVNGTNFSATIQGYPNHNYQLQYRDNLSSGSWQSVNSPVAGAGAPINFLHNGGATATNRFYRVRVD